MARKRSEVLALLERVSRLLTVDQYAEGLKPAQWEALRYLSSANRFSRTPGALTDYLGATKGTVSQTLMTLERKGYLVKRQAANDKRLVLLDLLPSGRAMMNRDPSAQMEAVIATLSDQDRRPLTDGLKKLLSAKLDADDKRSFGVCAACRYFQNHHPQGDPHRCGLLNEKLSNLDSEQICVEHEQTT